MNLLSATLLICAAWAGAALALVGAINAGVWFILGGMLGAAVVEAGCWIHRRRKQGGAS